MAQVVVTGPTLPQLDKSISEWVKAVTIDVAQKTLISSVANGFDNQPVVITDGVPRRDYTQVKPFGTIEFARRAVMSDAVLWALDELRMKSPVRTGRYVQSHIVMINGSEIQSGIKEALDNVRETDRVQIVNTQPYARKLEGRPASGRRTPGGQRKAVRGASRQARQGIYRVVLRELVSRYGKTIFVDLKYVKLNLGVTVSTKRGKKSTRVDQVYPALQFFIKSVG